MVQLVEKMQHQMLFLKAMQGAEYRFVSGQNPFLILVEGRQYWIFIKNITSAHFTNPDVSRAQLATRDVFAPIKDSDVDFILLGYDQENDVYATWNPLWIKQRLNSRDSLSLYSRFSLQKEAREEGQFKRMELSNGGEVLVFPREFVSLFFINVKSYFLAEGDYVAMGSKKRPEANEAFKTFADASNVADFARFLADEEMSQVTISNYCRVIKSLLSDGTISRNRKVFLQYDFLTEYRLAVPQFVDLDEVREKNEKWHNLISAALNSYIDYLTQAAPEITPDGLIPRIVEIIETEEPESTPKPQAVKENEPLNGDIFGYFCSEKSLTDFEAFLSAKDYRYSTVKRYIRAIKTLIQEGSIEKHKDTFLSCSRYSEYQAAADRFFEIPDIKGWNEQKHHEYSAAMKQYIAFLSETQAYAHNKEVPHLLQENASVPYGAHVDPEPQEEQVPVVHDWEAEYTDANGKLTRIANPKLIDIVRPYLDTEYPKKAAALNAVERFYGDRFSAMNLHEWGTLLNAINWSAPYAHDAPANSTASVTPTVTIEPPKRSKTHILRVEFPDGTVFQDKNVSETYSKTINKIDPELVALVELTHAGVGIVSKELDAKYAQYQKPIGGGWYVMTNSSTTQKCADLQTIAAELEIDLTVSLVPLDGSDITILPKVEAPEGARAKVRVTFPDGHIIQPSKVLDSLLEVVKYAGPEKVRELNIICCADNLILKNPAPRYQKPSKPVGDGWFCNTCSDTATKYAQMVEISNRLGLGLKVELI